MFSRVMLASAMRMQRILVQEVLNSQVMQHIGSYNIDRFVNHQPCRHACYKLTPWETARLDYSDMHICSFS